MAETRLECSNAGCANTILPTTAKRTGGLCGPCHGKLLKAKRDEYVCQNRKIVNPYEGVTDLTEILCLAHQEWPHDPLISYLPPPLSVEDLYTSLSDAQAQRLMTFATQSFARGERVIAENIARHLAAFTRFNLDEMLKMWVEVEHFWPAIAFRAAGEEICHAVLSCLRSSDVNANHALQAVAWIGGDSVINALQAFDVVLPSWAKRLYIRPSDYARTAGWELIDEKRRELTLRSCFAVQPVAVDALSDDLHLFREQCERCPWCMSPLVALLAIGVTCPQFLKLGIPAKSIDVITCSRCTRFSTIYAELDAEGHGHLATSNIPPDWIVDELEANPWAGKSIKLVERNPLHAADLLLSTKYTQIGGMPAWVQDVGYPECHKCGNTMIFLAQIDNGYFTGYEGMYYAFLCFDCQTTATTYQQT